ncbi:MAG: glycoside hydrolase family 3 protein, partial [Chloroflexi bacterium]|nr:glycoside hydrolase family 3 protein [Chloroflexota bacterium]
MARRAVRRLLLTLVGLAAIAASLIACASDDADPLSLEDAVGQMLLIGFRGETLDDETTALLEEISPGGVILFDYDGPSGGEQVRNIVSPEQLKALTADLQEASERPLLIAIDAEGGFVNRLKEDYGFEVQLPSHLAMGAGTPSETESLAGASARQLSDLGINWNLAPVVDVNVFPESPAIGYWERSFSDDPDAVADHAAA